MEPIFREYLSKIKSVKWILQLCKFYQAGRTVWSEGISMEGLLVADMGARHRHHLQCAVVIASGQRATRYLYELTPVSLECFGEAASFCASGVAVSTRCASCGQRTRAPLIDSRDQRARSLRYASKAT